MTWNAYLIIGVLQGIKIITITILNDVAMILSVHAIKPTMLSNHAVKLGWETRGIASLLWGVEFVFLPIYGIVFNVILDVVI